MATELQFVLRFNDDESVVLCDTKGNPIYTLPEDPTPLHMNLLLKTLKTYAKRNKEEIKEEKPKSNPVNKEQFKKKVAETTDRVMTNAERALDLFESFFGTEGKKK